MNKKMINLFRVVFSQLKTTITWSSIAIIIGTTLFALLSLMVVSTGTPDNNNRLVIRAIGEGTTYALIIRLIYSFKDKSTLDKNRISYLLFGKQSVAVGKILGDLALFFLQILIIVVLAPLIVHFKGGETSKMNIGSFAAYLFSISFFFAFTIIGIRFITAKIDNALIKWTCVGGWMMITVVFYLVFSILTALLPGVKSWFDNNKNWIAFMPILNFVTPSLLLSNLPVWIPFMMTIEVAIATVAIWKPFSTTLKTYLTA